LNRLPQVILASGSPRRLALLRSIGIEPLVQPAFFDEQIQAGEDAYQLVRRLAHGKLAAVLAHGLKHGGSAPPAHRKLNETAGLEGNPALLLGADTVVVLDGAVLGKPDSPGMALSMLERLSGRVHRVMTGLALMSIPDGTLDISVAETEVRFRELDPEEICAYVEREDVTDVAGAYRIQDLGAVLVREIHGSWSNVVGLPLELFAARVHALGFSVL